MLVLDPHADALLCDCYNRMTAEVALIQALGAANPAMMAQHHAKFFIRTDDKNNGALICDSSFFSPTSTAESGHVFIEREYFKDHLLPHLTNFKALLLEFAQILRNHAPGFQPRKSRVFPALVATLWVNSEDLRFLMRVNTWAADRAAQDAWKSPESTVSLKDLLVLGRAALSASTAEQSSAEGNAWTLGWNMGAGETSFQTLAGDPQSAYTWIAATQNHLLLTSGRSGAPFLVRHQPQVMDIMRECQSFINS